MDLITAACYAVKDFLAVISLIMIMHYIFLEKAKLAKVRTAALCAAVIINSFVGVFVLMKNDPSSDEFMDFISNVICILSVRFITSEKRWGRTIWIVMLYLMTSDMFFSLFSSVLPDTLLAECLFDIMLFLAVSVAIYVFSAKSAFNFLPKVFDEIPRWVFVAVMIFDLACYYKQFGISKSWYNAFYTVSSVMVILCIAYLMFRIFRLSYEQAGVLQQVHKQSEYFEQKLVANADLRSFRHDYKNHMIVIDALLKNGEIEQTRDYLETLNQSIKSAVNSVFTGNFVADAVVNNKIAAAQNKGISLSFSGRVPESGIEPQDLCLILSNLLDNAVEACEKEEEKTVEAVAGIRQGNFVFTVTNPCSWTTEKKNGVFKTSKQNKALHGIGLKNVKSAVEKYNGDFIAECENGVFTADVRVKIKQKITN